MYKSKVSQIMTAVKQRNWAFKRLESLGKSGRDQVFLIASISVFPFFSTGFSANLSFHGHPFVMSSLP